MVDKVCESRLGLGCDVIGYVPHNQIKDSSLTSYMLIFSPTLTLPYTTSVIEYRQNIQRRRFRSFFPQVIFVLFNSVKSFCFISFLFIYYLFNVAGYIRIMVHWRDMKSYQMPYPS